ncbi:unnamed protein product [Acanthosepion pharaonis]|uniref:Uncharacterized protein n=1 Tax=Acanthosepion pharaonis TaxID=158019 RepID=A0A812C0J8_ACAPH|nr:unnamed protein product [Sepia pharaonis]
MLHALLRGSKNGCHNLQRFLSGFSVICVSGHRTPSQPLLQYYHMSIHDNHLVRFFLRFLPHSPYSLFFFCPCHEALIYSLTISLHDGTNIICTIPIFIHFSLCFFFIVNFLVRIIISFFLPFLFCFSIPPSNFIYSFMYSSFILLTNFLPSFFFHSFSFFSSCVHNYLYVFLYQSLFFLSHLIFIFFPPFLSFHFRTYIHTFFLSIFFPFLLCLHHIYSQLSLHFYLRSFLFNLLSVCFSFIYSYLFLSCVFLFFYYLSIIIFLSVWFVMLDGFTCH